MGQSVGQSLSLSRLSQVGGWVGQSHFGLCPGFVPPLCSSNICPPIDALAPVEREAFTLSAVVPSVDLLHDRGDLVRVDLAHRVRVAAEALGPDLDLRDAGARARVVPHGVFDEGFRDGAVVEVYPARHKRQVVPVRWQYFVEVFLDDADAVVRFDGFGLDVLSGLEQLAGEVELFPFQIAVAGLCPDLVDVVVVELVGFAEPAVSVDVNGPPAAVACGVAQETLVCVRAADDDALAWVGLDGAAVGGPEFVLGAGDEALDWFGFCFAHAGELGEFDDEVAEEFFGAGLVFHVGDGE